VLELNRARPSKRGIDAALVVEEATIRTHVKRILMKPEVRDRIPQ
jgi:DNA-binding NarL/FixJ family response regulator